MKLNLTINGMYKHIILLTNFSNTEFVFFYFIRSLKKKLNWLSGTRLVIGSFVLCPRFRGIYILWSFMFMCYFLTINILSSWRFIINFNKSHYFFFSFATERVNMNIMWKMYEFIPYIVHNIVHHILFLLGYNFKSSQNKIFSQCNEINFGIVNSI